MDHMNSLAIGDEYRFRTKMETITEENKTLKQREDKLLDIMKRLERLEQMD